MASKTESNSTANAPTATGPISTSIPKDRRQQVLVGDLPDDFLRVASSPMAQQIAADHQTAAYLQSQCATAQPAFATQPVTRLSITVAQAKLNKNYGLTKMDPYCRLRIGHAVFETPTSNSGGKNPIWNRVIHAPLPNGVDSVYLEIFDERSFTMDDRVAWTHITIPAKVYSGETVDDWYPLSGKLGEDKEGTLNLVLSLSKVHQQPVYGQPIVYTPRVGGNFYTSSQPVVVVQGGAAPGAYPAVPGAYPPSQQPGVVPPQQPPVPQGPAFTEEDVKAMKEMFPNIDEEVIKSVLESNRGNKEDTINNLLSMESS